MATPRTATLEKLSDTNLTVKDPNEDIRGRKVMDKNGDDAGTVNDLLIDGQEQKVRLMEVGSGGFLGIGETTVLIPIDAVTRITDDAVHINQTREHVVRAPRYDPALANDQQYWGSIYGYYGYGPFWGMGYTYPAYPYFR
jgi:sporulation protein YlmC with PRC-barrel domain